MKNIKLSILNKNKNNTFYTEICLYLINNRIFYKKCYWIILLNINSFL